MKWRLAERVHLEVCPRPAKFSFIKNILVFILQHKLLVPFIRIKIVFALIIKREKERNFYFLLRGQIFYSSQRTKKTFQPLFLSLLAKLSISSFFLAHNVFEDVVIKGCLSASTSQHGKLVETLMTVVCTSCRHWPLRIQDNQLQDTSH